MRTLLLALTCLLIPTLSLADDTTILNFSTTWVNASQALTEGTIQNTGSRVIRVFQSGSQPGADQGHVLNPGISVIFKDLSGTAVWVQTTTGNGVVSITGD